MTTWFTRKWRRLVDGAVRRGRARAQARRQVKPYVEILEDRAVPAVVASDFFDYPLGELNGQNGGTGWAGAWTAATANTEVVNPGTPLSYAIPGGNTLDGGVTALEVMGDAASPAIWPAPSMVTRSTSASSTGSRASSATTTLQSSTSIRRPARRSA